MFPPFSPAFVTPPDFWDIKHTGVNDRLNSSEIKGCRFFDAKKTGRSTIEFCPLLGFLWRPRAVEKLRCVNTLTAFPASSLKTAHWIRISVGDALIVSTPLRIAFGNWGSSLPSRRDHLAMIASRAMARRCSDVNASARALPPFDAPNF